MTYVLDTHPVVWFLESSRRLRGYPETCQQYRAYLTQHPCGNERQDDHLERACSA